MASGRMLVVAALVVALTGCSSGSNASTQAIRDSCAALKSQSEVIYGAPQPPAAIRQQALQYMIQARDAANRSTDETLISALNEAVNEYRTSMVTGQPVATSELDAELRALSECKAHGFSVQVP